MTNDARGSPGQASEQAAQQSRLLAAYSVIRRMIARRLDHHADAADLAQEVWLKLHSRGESLDNPSAYGRRVAANLLVDRVRQDRMLTGDAILDDMACTAPSAEQMLVARERMRLVLAAADRLPPKCREVFYLRKIEGLEQQEIAARMGISMNMVQKHLRKALAEIHRATED